MGVKTKDIYKLLHGSELHSCLDDSVCVFFVCVEVGVGLGIGLCCVPSAEGGPGIYIHTLSPGSVAHMDGRLRYREHFENI